MLSSRSVGVVFCLGLVAGCGSSPTAPAPAAQAPAPAPAPAPTPPPTPVFPSLAGQWNGTVSLTMAVISIGQSVTATCNSTWTNGSVNSASGAFSGTLSVTGSAATNAANCSGGENYTGTVTTAGAITIPNFVWSIGGVSWNGTPLNDATCGLKAVTVPLAGTVSGRSWTMTQKDSWLCINQTVQVDRTILVQLAQ